MAKTKKRQGKKNITLPFGLKKEAVFSFLIKLTAPLIALCLVLILAHNTAMGIINSPYFTVKKVNLTGTNDISNLNKAEILFMAKEKDIFTVDIRRMARDISAKHAEFEKVTVKRVMPDTLAVSAIPRQPFAAIKANDYYVIDKSCVLFPKGITVKERIPLVTGISVWTMPKAGEVFRSRQLELAVLILNIAREIRLFNGARIETVDVANTRDLRFYINTGLEIKLGSSENIKDKFIRLSMVLNDPAININTLKYIDLRFDDVVLQPK